MSPRFLAASALLFIASFSQAEPLPPHLVGIWSSEDTVLNGQLLASGQALYLGADGVGAWMGGPPPIGVKVRAQFDPKTNQLALDFIENAKVVGRKQVGYDPSKKVMTTTGAKPVALQRRANELTDATKKSLGL